MNQGDQVTNWIDRLGAMRSDMEAIGGLEFMFLLMISVLASVFISFLYLQFYSSRATGSDVYRAFPILGPSVTAIKAAPYPIGPQSLALIGSLTPGPFLSSDEKE